MWNPLGWLWEQINKFYRCNPWKNKAEAKEEDKWLSCSAKLRNFEETQTTAKWDLGRVINGILLFLFLVQLNFLIQYSLPSDFIQSFFSPGGGVFAWAIFFGGSGGVLFFLYRMTETAWFRNPVTTLFLPFVWLLAAFVSWLIQTSYHGRIPEQPPPIESARTIFMLGLNHIPPPSFGAKNEEAGELRVVIYDFFGDDGSQTDMIYQQIRDGLKSFDNVKIEKPYSYVDIKEQDKVEEEMRELAHKQGVDIGIWGMYADGALEPRFIIPTFDEGDVLASQLGAIEMRRSVKVYARVVTAFTIGVVALLTEENPMLQDDPNKSYGELALEAFDNAIYWASEDAEKGPKDGGYGDVLHFFRARSLATINPDAYGTRPELCTEQSSLCGCWQDCQEQALDAFTTTLQLNKYFSWAMIGIGNYHFQQATKAKSNVQDNLEQALHQYTRAITTENKVFVRSPPSALIEAKAHTNIGHVWYERGYPSYSDNEEIIAQESHARNEARNAYTQAITLYTKAEQDGIAVPVKYFANAHCYSDNEEIIAQESHARNEARNAYTQAITLYTKAEQDGIAVPVKYFANAHYSLATVADLEDKYEETATEYQHCIDYAEQAPIWSGTELLIQCTTGLGDALYNQAFDKYEEGGDFAELGKEAIEKYSDAITRYEDADKQGMFLLKKYVAEAHYGLAATYKLMDEVTNNACTDSEGVERPCSDLAREHYNKCIEHAEQDAELKQWCEEAIETLNNQQ